MNFALFFIFFSSPILFGRVLWGSDQLTFLLLALFFIYIFINKGQLSYNVNKTKFFISIGLLIYFLFTTIIRFSIGENISDISIHLFQFAALILLMSIPINKDSIESFYNAILFSLIIHSLTLMPFLPFYEWIQGRLSSYTAYYSGEYDISIFSRRGTGFFPSPGYLSLFSSCSLALGSALFSIKKDRRSLLIIIFSLICGLATFNRSFFVAIVLLLIYIIHISKIGGKLSLLLMMLVALPSLQMFLNFDYVFYIFGRFESLANFMENDRVVGETGVITTIQAIMKNPFFGSPFSENGGYIKVLYEGSTIRPHVGFLTIIAYYGLLVAWPILIIYFASFFSSVGILLQRKNSLYNLATPIHLANLIICVLLLFEPLIDTALVLFYMVVSLCFNSVKIERDFSNKSS